MNEEERNEILLTVTKYSWRLALKMASNSSRKVCHQCFESSQSTQVQCSCQGRAITGYLSEYSAREINSGCLGPELDPSFVDLVVWHQNSSGGKCVLSSGGL